jgi:ATP-dependent RNA helicase DDX60
LIFYFCILSKGNDVIVFVSPTKALANQVAAEIYARFGNEYAMLMPDYNIYEPYQRRILITIPTMLETVLCKEICSKQEWLSSVKYVILDEVQTINDKELGPSIEKILNYLDCPILALSATIANFTEFSNWFESLEMFKEKRKKLHKITYYERYCDLQKFLFVPQKHLKDLSNALAQSSFNSGPDDSTETLVPISELFAYPASYIKNGQFSQDFHLLPTEIVSILDAIELVCANNQEMVDSIRPNKFFKTTLISKNEVKSYEKFLIDTLREWIANEKLSEEQLERFYFRINSKCEKAFELLKREYDLKLTTDEWALENIYELVKSLHEKDMLPAIVFAKTCNLCNQLAFKLTTSLEKEEKEAAARQNKDAKKKEKHVKKLQRNLKNEDLSDDEKSMLRSSIAAMQDNVTSIDDKYTFFNPKYRLSNEEIQEEIRLHRYRTIDRKLFEGWKRGIGVHHADFHTKVRSSTEYLFRKRHLQIVFATETLALGINMPCKTVIINKDAMKFDSMLYRQMVGRAGRRGFDTIGNIVYFGLPQNAVKNLISSELIEIKGQFTHELKNIIQSSVLYSCNSQNMKLFQSSLRYPTTKLIKDTDDKLESTELVKMEINYLIENDYLDDEFRPTALSALLMPLRQLKCSAFLICEFIRKKIYKQILDYNNSSVGLEENCDRLILSISHFTDVSILNKSLIENINKEVILPNIPELDNFLVDHYRSLKAYLQWAFEQSEFTNKSIKLNRAYLNKAFSYTFSQDLKNSFIYNFYKKENLTLIEEVNCITTTRLWYALETFRKIINAIIGYIKNYSFDSVFLSVLTECEKIMKKKFDLIKN